MANHLKYLTRITNRTLRDVVENYSLTAILLNAVDVARRYYESRKDKFELSTILRIPEEFRTGPTDIDRRYSKDELIKAYSVDTIRKIGTDYLIRTVAVIDAYIEDVHSYLLKHFSGDEKFDKSPWRNDSFRRLVKKIPLHKPKNRITTIDMALDRYEEFREFRHAVLHQRGTLTAKQIEKFRELRDRENEVSKQYGLELSDYLPFYEGLNVEILLDYIFVLALRQWSHSFLFYMMACYEATPAINKKLVRK